jgi:hypothetical protein
MEIRILKIPNETIGFITFNNKSDCLKVNSFFNDPYKLENCPSRNSNKEIIEISYAYDLTDAPDSLWYAVVLRNLNFYCTDDMIKAYFSNFYTEILYVQKPLPFRNFLCTMIVFKDLDEAERICSQFNQQYVRVLSGNYPLKVS